MRRDDATRLDAVLERGRVVARVPEAVRARVLARARQATGTVQSEALAPALPNRRRRQGLLALAASLVLAIVTATAVAAFHGREGDVAPAAAAPTTPSREVPSRVGVLLPMPPESPPAAPLGSAAPRERNPHARPSREPYAAELALLHRAQAAQAARRFVDALELVDEHGRRFPAGRLVEEREALRVRALAGAGRADEARRAAAAFAQRFPRSVFLPRLGVSLER